MAKIDASNGNVQCWDGGMAEKQQVFHVEKLLRGKAKKVNYGDFEK